MMNQPLVTIGVASYNNSAYVIDTLESIRKQSYKNIELIIVDDCSIDDSVVKIKEWINNNPTILLKFIQHERNEKIPKVFNEVLRFATGQYLAIIGSDDLFEFDRVEKQVEFLNKNSNVTMVFSDMYVINQNGDRLNDSYLSYINETDQSVKEFLKQDKLEKIERTIRKNIFPAPTFMFVTKDIIEIKGWDEKLYFEDWDMNLYLINNGYKIGFLNKKLISYRVLNTSVARKPNPFYYESILESVSKYRNFSNRINKAIDEKIEEYALKIYRNDGADSLKWLKELWKSSRKTENLFMLMFAHMNIKYSTLKRIKRW